MGPRAPFFPSFSRCVCGGVFCLLCRPSSPLGMVPFSAVAGSPGAGDPLVRLPICLSLMLTRASRGAAPEGVSGWRGPCLQSHKHWGSGIPASSSRTPSRSGTEVPSSLPALGPGLSAQCRTESGGILPPGGSDHTRDGGCCGTPRPWESLLLGVSSSLVRSLTWCSWLSPLPAPLHLVAFPSRL